MRGRGDIEINGRKVGRGYPTYVVAELSANHGRDFSQAMYLVKAAKDAGADAVKLQTYTPSTMTIESTQEFFQIRGGTLWDGRTLYDLYREAYMPWDWQPKLKSYADELQIDLFSSGFDATAVDFLEDMGVPAHKVASLEIVDIPLVEKMASTHKPLIISTGAATLREIEEAVSAAQSRGAAGIALLKCTSAYPAPPAEMNLRTLAHLWETFGLPVGVSDHTLGAVVPIVAVALGACIVEKHFTLSRTHPGPDSAFSLEPHEFKAMVEAIRVAEKAVGDVNYGVTREERKCSDYRRSLFVVKDIKAGEMFTEENVRSIRPGGGLLPKYVQDVIGKKANQNLERGTPLRWDHIAKS